MYHNENNTHNGEQKGGAHDGNVGLGCVGVCGGEYCMRVSDGESYLHY